MGPSTRQKILSYLQDHRRASAPELANALEMTRATMRYHLSQLVEQGLIQTESREDTPKRRGRPVLVYRIAVTARPNNYSQLANTLLDFYLSSNESGIDQEERLRQLGRSLADTQNLPKNLTQRLTHAIQILNDKHYQARWEARPQGPQVLFRNCPYAAILPQHPELCMMDVYLLEHLLSVPIVQLAKIGLQNNRPPACLFALFTKKPETEP